MKPSTLVIFRACQELSDDQDRGVLDADVAQHTKMLQEDVRNHLRHLKEEGFIDLFRVEQPDGLKAVITSKGWTELSTLGPLGNGPRTTLAEQKFIKVVPKGLRSFDEHDADFFLELLPGPRHADGLPESIHFWKTRIEETAPDRTFAVGVIYGPSGCGKSSLVKAGLLPRLKSVLPVYLEATADDTEVRLLKGLGRHFPDLHADRGLRDTLSALRAGTGSSATNKVLIVLDQFEQWLHAKRSEEGTELALALGQCDGERLQALLMVRDDFWMALTRFMGEMGIALKQWENFAAVDLFDLRHARKVLTAFGQAFGTLPDRLEDLGEQKFLDQAVNGLARDGRIISVRLALFAEMAKGKPWTPATLKEVGGMEGIGVTFLEETFGSIALKAHQKSAEHVLKALLPESGTSIKGHMRSHEELMKASGYAARPKAFGDLLHILDSETRLITPIDPEGIDTEGEERHDPEGRFYQLTHDYLVPSLREWLTRKQRETRRGRAELRLAERSALWNAKPENRLLPSFWEWVTIGLLTRKKDWTEPQKKMMRGAGRVHGLSAVGAIVVGTGLIIIALTIYAGNLVRQLRTAEITEVPDIVLAMQPVHFFTDRANRNALRSKDEDQKLRASLALLPVDATQVDYLFNRLIKIKDIPSEVGVLRDALKTHRPTLTPKLWTVLESAKQGDAGLLPAASALASYAPDDAKWEAEGSKVAKALLSVNSISLGDWLKYLTDVRSKLKPPLATIFRDKKLSESERTQVTNILADYASDDPDLLADLLLDSEEKPFAVLFDKLKARQERAVPVLEAELARKPAPDATADAQDQLAQRQARAAVALVRLGQGEKVWNLLRHSPDPSVRSYIVNWLKPLGAGPEALMTKLEGLAHDPVSIPKDGKSRMDAILFHRETSDRRALILALGRYNLDELSPDKREPLVEHLREMYRNDPDSGIHGAAEWALRQWKQQEKLKELDAELMKLKDRGERRWYVNGQGQTFAVIEGPVEFLMGSPPTDTEQTAGNEPLRRMAIPRRFAIAAKEVTVEQFQRFLKLGGITIESYQLPASFLSKFSPDPKGPWIAPDWYTAAHYCNWLSEQEGLPKEHWCYLPNEAGAYAEGMSIPADVLQRTGYRLPTEAEWEYACRAGTVTSRYYGHSLDLLYAYAWYQANSKEHAWTCGSLFPNDLGLFDMLGNTYEWCQDSSNASRPAKEGIYNDTINISESIIEKNPRLLRGGTFDFLPAVVRSAYRDRLAPSGRSTNFGFRPSRTYH